MEQCPSVRVLGAQNADLAGSAFAALLSMPNLTALDLEGTRFDEKMAKKISRSITTLILESRSVKRVWLDGVRLERHQQDALEAKLESLRYTS